MAQDHSLSQITRYIVHIHEYLVQGSTRVLSAKIHTVATVLTVKRRRIYDIVNVLEALHVTSRNEEKGRYRWHGTTKVRATRDAKVANRTSRGLARGDRNWPLHEAQRPSVHVVRVARGTRASIVERGIGGRERNGAESSSPTRIPKPSASQTLSSLHATRPSRVAEETRVADERGTTHCGRRWHSWWRAWRRCTRRPST